jgi:hypothetical protein
MYLGGERHGVGQMRAQLPHHAEAGLNVLIAVEMTQLKGCHGMFLVVEPLM